MDPRRDQSERMLNRLAAAQLISTALVVLLIAVAAVLLNAQARRATDRVDQRLSDLTQRVSDLEAAAAQRPSRDTSHTRPPAKEPPAPQPAAEPAPTTPVSPVPPAGTGPGDQVLRLRREIADAAQAGARAAEIGAVLRALDASPAGVPADAALAAAELALAIGNADAALRWAERAAAHEPADRPATHLQAVLHAAARRFDMALPLAARAAEIENCPPRRLWLLATVQVSLGRTDEAQATLKRLLATPQTAKDPALLAEAGAMAAALALDRGDTARAAELHALASSARPDDAAVRRIGARLLIVSGKYEEGVSAVRELLAADPRDRALLDALGQGLLKLNKAGEALEPLRRSAELDPADAAAQDHVGLALLALLKPADAAAAFDRAISLDGDNPAYWYHLGVARINADDCPAAMSALDTAMLRDAKYARAHLARALCLARAGDDGAATQALTQALGLDGGLINEAQQIDAFQKLLAAEDRPVRAENPAHDAVPATLAGHVALVTGAARRVGRAIALELARAGCDVAVHFHRSGSEAAELAKAINSMGRRAVLVPGDLGAPSWPSIVNAAVEELGRLDILVNNASIFPSPRSDDLASFDPLGWDEMFRINTVAPVGLCHHAVPHLKTGGRGRIVNLVDAAVDRPWSTHLAYCASKAALVCATKSLARALAPEILVNGIAPGIAAFPESYDEALKAKLTARVPLKRAGTPEDIARACRYLVESDYVTGQIITVDGGRNLA